NLVDPPSRSATRLCWAALAPPGVGHRRDALVMRHVAGRRLGGAGNSWTFHWTVYPEPRYLAMALTHPWAGIRGAGFTRRADAYRVALGTATLELCDGKG
ncbi:hypothetical protein, partial [Saccharothrix sp. ST-888]|uniref:hypothetical protein n=1 Tax=Saccharothrix sp. ST-888 TaxID=1427391 RepID=UPI0005ED08A8